MEKRSHSGDHAEARPDAADRRLSPHAGDADRRRRVLRHADHHPRDRTPLSVADLVSAGRRPARPGRLSLWTDRAFFQNAVNLVFGTLGPKVPQAFVEDRSQMRGAKFDVDKMRAAIPQMRDQLRAHLGWIEAQLSDGRKWLLGEFSLADASAYMNVWYLRSNLSAEDDQAIAGLDHIFAGLEQVPVWESRVRALGHGRREEMSAGEALAIAAKASPGNCRRERSGRSERTESRRYSARRARRLRQGRSGRRDRFALGAAHRDTPRRRARRRDRGPFPARGFSSSSSGAEALIRLAGAIGRG